MNPNAPFERDLEQWLQAEAPASAPADLHATVIDRARTKRQRPGWATSRPARWFGRNRGITLLAAGALLLVGGAAAAGSGLVRLPSLVPQPAPSLALVPTPVPASSSLLVSPSPAPSETSAVVAPKPAVFVFNKGGGTSAECGNDGRGGCIPRMWVSNLDGTGARELVPDQSGCQGAVAWSPDGTRLLFARSECKWTVDGMFGAERFYLTDASGSEPQLVDTGCVDPCVSEEDAVFSSDGRRILFVRTKSVPVSPSATPDPVTGKPAEATQALVLASIDLSTGRVTELGAFDECDQCATDWTRSYPLWSPDRTQIVFTEAAQVPVGPQPPTDPAVFVADADGRNVHQVSAAGQSPAWSPDGTRIVFQGDRYTWPGTWFPGKEIRFFSDIYTIRPDGTDLRRLTSDEISYGPGWSADGRIWFYRTPRVDGHVSPDEQAENWVMDADGSNASQLSGQPPFQAWQVQPTP